VKHLLRALRNFQERRMQMERSCPIGPSGESEDGPALYTVYTCVNLSHKPWWEIDLLNNILFFRERTHNDV
jgi:hypothetical protein